MNAIGRSYRVPRRRESASPCRDVVVGTLDIGPASRCDSALPRLGSRVRRACCGRSRRGYHSIPCAPCTRRGHARAREIGRMADGAHHSLFGRRDGNHRRTPVVAAARAHRAAGSRGPRVGVGEDGRADRGADTGVARWISTRAHFRRRPRQPAPRSRAHEGVHRGNRPARGPRARAPSQCARHHRGDRSAAGIAWYRHRDDQGIRGDHGAGGGGAQDPCGRDLRGAGHHRGGADGRDPEPVVPSGPARAGGRTGGDDGAGSAQAGGSAAVSAFGPVRRGGNR